MGKTCALLTTLLLAGCSAERGATSVRSEATPTNLARVCVIRPSETSKEVAMEVRDNGRLVGATRGATYFCYLAAPGPHQIVGNADNTGPVLAHLQAGGRYWLHQEISLLTGALGALGSGDAHGHLDWIDDATASELIERCDERVRVSVPGTTDDEDTLPIARSR